MESNRADLAAQLRDLDRAETASWVDYPPVRWWWAPMFGVWSAGYVLVIGFLHGWRQSVAFMVLLAVMFGVIAWQRRVRGTYPRGRAPRELRGPFVKLGVGAAATALLAWGTAVAIGVWAAAVVVAVLVTALIVFYERLYAAAAARVRERVR